MREILFRGKRKRTGEWVYGAFCQKDSDSPFGEMVDKPSIIKYDDPYSGFWFEVDPKTVGQFTGLTDRNGQKIFEGDMVVSFDAFGRENSVGPVKWDSLFSAWTIGPRTMYGTTIASYEIIGDIYDNAEMEAEENK